jgi:hypothetical protein
MAKQAGKAGNPWGGWRENARELAIVVVGVLVALLAQQVVQDFEWRQKTNAALDAMRHELLWDDGPQIYQRAVSHSCAVARLDAIRAAVEAGRSRVEIRRLIDDYDVLFFTYDSAALDAAVASETFTHLTHEESAPFNNVYPSIPVFNRTAEREAVDLAALRALRRTGGPLSDAEADATLARVEALRNDERVMFGGAKWVIPNLREIGPLDRGRLAEFLGSARRQYGDCAKPLPANWPDRAGS